MLLRGIKLTGDDDAGALLEVGGDFEGIGALGLCAEGGLEPSGEIIGGAGILKAEILKAELCQPVKHGILGNWNARKCSNMRVLTRSPIDYNFELIGQSITPELGWQPANHVPLCCFAAEMSQEQLITLPRKPSHYGAMMMNRGISVTVKIIAARCGRIVG